MLTLLYKQFGRRVEDDLAGQATRVRATDTRHLRRVTPPPGRDSLDPDRDDDHIAIVRSDETTPAIGKHRLVPTMIRPPYGIDRYPPSGRMDPPSMAPGGPRIPIVTFGIGR